MNTEIFTMSTEHCLCTDIMNISIISLLIIIIIKTKGGDYFAVQKSQI